VSAPPELIRLAVALVERAVADRNALRVLAAHPEVASEIAGVHAEQAVEKGLKAALAVDDVEPPRTHDIPFLVELLQAADVTPPITSDDADALYPYAVEFRYAGSIDEDALHPTRMVEIADLVVVWVLSFTDDARRSTST